MCASDRVLRAWVGLQGWLAQSQDALLCREDGQGLVEYALIVCMLSVLAIAIMMTVGSQATNIFGNVSAQLGLSPAN